MTASAITHSCMNKPQAQTVAPAVCVLVGEAIEGRSVCVHPATQVTLRSGHMGDKLPVTKFAVAPSPTPSQTSCGNRADVIACCE